MGPLGPLPWKMMDHILKSWDNDSGPCPVGGMWLKGQDIKEGPGRIALSVAMPTADPEVT